MIYDNVNLKHLLAGLSLDPNVSSEKRFSPVDDQGDLKKMASATAEKLMSDLDLLDLAHPDGSTFLEGIEGDAEVEDLKAQRKKMELVVNKQVKINKANLYRKLMKLSHDLSQKGYDTLASSVDYHISKIAMDFGLGITPKDKSILPGELEFDGQINQSVAEFSAIIESMLSALLYGTGANDQQQSQINQAKADILSILPGLGESLKSRSGSHTVTLLKSIAQKIHPLITEFSMKPKVSELLPTYKEAFSDIAGLAQALKGSLSEKPKELSKVEEKYDQAGSKNVNRIIDIFEQTLMGLLYPIYTGTVRTWVGLEADLKKHFGLYPSSTKSLPPGGKTYSNWQQLEELVKQELEKYKELDRDLVIGIPEAAQQVGMDALDIEGVKELSKMVKQDPEKFKGIDLSMSKPDVTMDTPHANFKGAPKAPVLQ